MYAGWFPGAVTSSHAIRSNVPHRSSVRRKLDAKGCGLVSTPPWLSAILDLASMYPALGSALFRMKRILTALLLIIIVVALIFFGQLWMLTLTTCLVAELAAYEYLTLANSSGARIPIWWMECGRRLNWPASGTHRPQTRPP